MPPFSIAPTELGRHFRITIELVDAIPDAPNGKLQYLVPLPQR
jgi:hypothetical protein